MKSFEFVAVAADGTTLRGREDAVDERQLDRELDRRGVVLVRARPARAEGGSLSTRELIAFTSQLSVTVEAGVPLLEALDGLARRSLRPDAKRVIERLGRALRAGAPLSEAMGREPRSFPLVYRASVQAGEASGSLAPLLVRLGQHMEWQEGVRATARQALIYPAFLGLALVGLVVLMLTFLIPRLASLYPGGRADLPVPTQIVLGLSDQVQALAPLLGVLAVAGGVAFVVLRRRRAFQVRFDRLLLRIPLLGSVLHQVATSRFASVASTLQAAGCDIRQVIEIAATSCGNAAIGASLERVGAAAQRGSSLTEGLSREPLADPLLAQLVAVGESSGDLDGCLARLATWYDQDVPRRVKRFLAVLEPALLLVSAVIVGFLLLATLLPIFKLYDTLG